MVEARRIRELEAEVARLQALVTDLTRENGSLRGERTDEVLLGPGGLRLVSEARTVAVGELTVPLSAGEFTTLQLLLRRRGEVVGTELLAGEGGRQAVEARVSRLRRKLRWAGAGLVIRTRRGVGYTIP